MSFSNRSEKLPFSLAGGLVCTLCAIAGSVNASKSAATDKRYDMRPPVMGRERTASCESCANQKLSFPRQEIVRFLTAPRRLSMRKPVLAVAVLGMLAFTAPVLAQQAGESMQNGPYISAAKAASARGGM